MIKSTKTRIIRKINFYLTTLILIWICHVSKMEKFHSRTNFTLICIKGKKLLSTSATSDRIRVKILSVEIISLLKRQHRPPDWHLILHYPLRFPVFTWHQGLRRETLRVSASHLTAKNIRSSKSTKLIVEWERKWLTGYYKLLRHINVRTKHSS